MGAITQPGATWVLSPTIYIARAQLFGRSVSVQIFEWNGYACFCWLHGMMNAEITLQYGLQAPNAKNSMHFFSRDAILTLAHKLGDTISGSEC